MKEVPPKHLLKAPRPWFAVFRTYGGSLTIFAAVLCLVVTVVSVMIYRTADRYDRVGVVAQAQSIARRISTDSDGDDTYYVTFLFAAEGQTVERERSVSRDLHRRARAGALHEIRYLPDTPRKFETYIGQSRYNAKVAQVVAGVAGVAGLFLLWFRGGRTNQAVLARRYGHRCVAVVENVVETKNSGRPTGHGYLVWRTADGLRGESRRHPIAKLRAIGIDAEINVYVRKGHSVWEGDVGPRHTPDSALPKVRR